MHPISKKLIAWYSINKRDLPWRNTDDPYKIWLSEVILQQTQVIQGLNYYLKFTETFPTVVDLANAPEDQVMRLWQGLGYYSRARNLHAAAKHVKENFGSVFPETYEEIKSLKGVGDYTAAAISSIAFNLPHAVVDGNVYRVLSRLFNIHTPIDSTVGKKEFQLLANELLDKKNPAIYNNALMEFGAVWCKPQNPKCENCSLQEYCLAFQNNTVSILPIKDKKTKIRNRFFNYFIFNYSDDIYIQKRIQKDIWQNLYEFYLVETDSLVSEDDLINEVMSKQKISNFTITFIYSSPKHILSHQHIYARFFEIKISKPLQIKNMLKVKKSELNEYGLPQLINKYLNK